MFYLSTKQHIILKFYSLVTFPREKAPNLIFGGARLPHGLSAFFGDAVRNRLDAFSRAAPADLSDVARACLRLIAS